MIQVHITGILEKEAVRVLHLDHDSDCRRAYYWDVNFVRTTWGCLCEGRRKTRKKRWYVGTRRRMLVGRVVSWLSTSEYRNEQKKNIYLLGVDTLGLSDRLYVGVTSPRVLG